MSLHFVAYCAVNRDHILNARSDCPLCRIEELEAGAGAEATPKVEAPRITVHAGVPEQIRRRVGRRPTSRGTPMNAELSIEKSRDRWIAMNAAEQFLADGGPEDVDTEALSALADWITSELWDRHYTKYAGGLPF